jgi:hypothetical protein
MASCKIWRTGHSPDVFEEGGVVKTSLRRLGPRAVGGIPKPSFNAFALLHQLGRSASPEVEEALLTRRQLTAPSSCIVELP